MSACYVVLSVSETSFYNSSYRPVSWQYIVTQWDTLNLKLCLHLFLIQTKVPKKMYKNCIYIYNSLFITHEIKYVLSQNQFISLFFFCVEKLMYSEQILRSKMVNFSLKLDTKVVIKFW